MEPAGRVHDTEGIDDRRCEESMRDVASSASHKLRGRARTLAGTAVDVAPQGGSGRDLPGLGRARGR